MRVLKRLNLHSTEQSLVSKRVRDIVYRFCTRPRHGIDSGLILNKRFGLSAQEVKSLTCDERFFLIGPVCSGDNLNSRSRAGWYLKATSVLGIPPMVSVIRRCRDKKRKTRALST
jgi:hypothetical protein